MPRESTPRSRALLVVGLLVLAGLSVHRLVLAPVPTTKEPDGGLLRGEAMGTTWSARLGAEASIEPAEAGQLIEAAFNRVNASMSTYREDSELSQLSRHPVGEPFSVSEPLLAVLEAAEDISRRSGGAFDVTVGPLVRLWGFGAGRATSEPTEAELAAARESVGYARLGLDPAGRTATRAVAGLQVDLSAIAKGFAVDLAAEALEGAGVRNYLIELGGELRVSGQRALGKPWRVGIEAPREDGTRAVHRVLVLEAGCVATSGDYRNYRDTPDGRVSHTIDPRVGRPVPRTVASVSVVHPRCTMADGWATALTVLGREEGMAVAEREGLAVLLLARAGEPGPDHPWKLEEHASPAFVSAYGAAASP